MSIRAEKKTKGEVPLNGPIGTDRDGNEITLADVLSSDEDVARRAEQNQQNNRLREAVRLTLTPREQKVIIMRYGLGGEGCYAQWEVGQELGISRSYVSRIEKKALRKLNDALTDD